VTQLEEYILEKKKGIVLFDEGKEGKKMLYIDDDGFLQMPKKLGDEIVLFDDNRKKRVFDLIRNDKSE